MDHDSYRGAVSEHPYWDSGTRNFMVREENSSGTARVATHEEIKALLDEARASNRDFRS